MTDLECMLWLWRRSLDERRLPEHHGQLIEYKQLTRIAACFALMVTLLF
jgi:hypothetical protein